MDRSFLSQAEVVAASRKFVCVRLATYEDKDEGAFLKSLLLTRSGELENSVFVILSADGTPLIRAARSPKQHYADAAQMAKAMDRIASDNAPKAGASSAAPLLPRVANVRLALDVAACDNQPLVVLYTPDATTAKAMHEALTAL